MLKKWQDNKSDKEKKELVTILGHNGLIVLIILHYMVKKYFSDVINFPN